MTFMLTRVRVDDYEAWKRTFDSDPAGARKTAKGHRILRSAEEPDELFVQVEFESPEDASAARDKLLGSGILDRVDIKSGPTVAELADLVTY